jgi:hypothetical protein
MLLPDHRADDGNMPPVSDVVALKARKEEQLKRGQKELREKGYDGSFVVASVRPSEGVKGVAKPGCMMAEGRGSGNGKVEAKAKYQATITD